MKKIFIIAITVLTVVACGHKPPKQTSVKPISPEKNLPGDSTLYGLACEGCTDSVVIILPNSGGDPITYDIINASKQHKVYGRPKVGDWIALMIDSKDKKTCRMVIDIDELKGKWCYLVQPTLRAIAGMSKSMAVKGLNTMPDSIKDKIMVPREYGINILREYIARPIGHNKQGQEDRMGPVTYPSSKSYSGWRLFNGHLILTSGGMDLSGKKTPAKEIKDTADIIFMRRDSLILKFKDHTQSFYRKTDDKSDKK